MYTLCVGQGWISPREFWAMPPGELWWLIEAKMPKQGMAESTAQELLDMLDKELAREAAEG